MVSLLALSEIYKDKKDIPENELKEVFEQVAFYARKNLTLMDQFIQLARVESEPSLELNFIDFFEVVEEATLEVDAMAKNKGIKLHKLFEAEDAWVSGNMELLTRVVVNLLSNAIKYSYEASEVSVRLYLHEGRICCCVEDAGFGIEKSELKHLFQRFYRSSRPLSRKEQGVGLGLRFVEVAVDRLAGDIKVDSELGKGSRFTISFPSVDMEQPIMPELRPAPIESA
jgi:signal transduction histidine kinase